MAPAPTVLTASSLSRSKRRSGAGMFSSMRAWKIVGWLCFISAERPHGCCREFTYSVELLEAYFSSINFRIWSSSVFERLSARDCQTAKGGGGSNRRREAWRYSWDTLCWIVRHLMEQISECMAMCCHGHNGYRIKLKERTAAAFPRYDFSGKHNSRVSTR